MIKIDFNNEFQFEPKNGDELDLDFSFNNFSPNPSLVSEFVMQLVCSQSQDPIKFVKDWITKNSIIQNIPTTLILDDGYRIEGQTKLGSSQSSYVFGQGQNTQFNVLFEPNMNIFFEKAQNLAFPTFLTESDWVKIRYITERDSRVEDALFTLIFAQMTIEAGRLAYNIADSIKEAISTGFDSVSAAIKFGLKIAMNLVYAALIVKVYSDLLKELSEIAFDKPKQLYALDVWSTIQKACDYLGYNFNSSLKNDFKNLTYLPTTTTAGVVTGTPKNNPNLNTSFFDFLENIGKLFNAKLKVLNNELTFENVSYFENNPANIQLLDLYNTGSQTFNFEELPEKISLVYQKVPSDFNYKDNEYIKSYSPNFGDKKLFGVENAIDVIFPFALGQRKEEQNFSEKTFNKLFDIIKGLSKNYKIKKGDRIGYLKLIADAVPVDTLFIREGEKIHKDSNLKLQTKTLFENYYELESPINNQFVTVTSMDKQPLCGINTNKLLENNVIKDNQGRTIIVNSNVRDSRNGLYDISYKRRLKPSDFGYIPESLISTHTKSVNNS